jgi:ketopantoate hydroxymethyltransferase
MSVQSAVRRKTAPDICARKGGEPIEAAVEAYAGDMHARAFPAAEHVYYMR